MKWKKHRPHGKSIDAQLALLADWIKKNYVGLQIRDDFYQQAAQHGKRVFLAYSDGGKLETKKATITCFHNPESFYETGIVASIVAYKSKHESATVNLRQLCNEMNEPYYQDGQTRNLSVTEINAAKENQKEIERANLAAQQAEYARIDQSRLVSKIFAQVEVQRAVGQQSISYFNDRYKSKLPNITEHNYLEKKGLSNHGIKVLNPFPIKLEALQTCVEENFNREKNGAALSKHTPILNGVQWDKFKTPNSRIALAQEVFDFQQNLSTSFRSSEKQPIVLPMQDVNGHIVNMQTITKLDQDENGNNFKNKFYLKGALRSGAFISLGTLNTDKPEQVTRIITCEGWATGMSINDGIKGKVPVLPALDVEGLKSGVPEMLKKFPNARIVIAVDNDHIKHLHEDPRKRINAGLRAGIEIMDQLSVADKARVSLISPPWKHNTPEHSGMSDFNDLAVFLANKGPNGAERFKAMLMQEFHGVADRKKANIDEVVYWTAQYSKQQEDYRNGRDDMPKMVPVNLAAQPDAEQRIEAMKAYDPQIAKSAPTPTQNSAPTPLAIAPTPAIHAHSVDKVATVETTPSEPVRSNNALPVQQGAPLSLLDRIANLEKDYTPEQLRVTQTLNIGGKPENQVPKQAAPMAVVAPGTPSLLDRIANLEKDYTPEQLRVTQTLNIGGKPENQVPKQAAPLSTNDSSTLELMDARQFTQGLVRYQRQVLVAKEVLSKVSNHEYKPEFLNAAVQHKLLSNPEHQLVMDAINPQTRDVVLDQLKQHAEKNPEKTEILNVHRLMNDFVLAHLANESAMIGINTKHIAVALADDVNKDKYVGAVQDAVKEITDKATSRSVSDAFIEQLENSFKAIDQTKNWSNIIDQAKFVSDTLDKANRFQAPNTAKEINSAILSTDSSLTSSLP